MTFSVQAHLQILARDGRAAQVTEGPPTKLTKYRQTLATSLACGPSSRCPGRKKEGARSTNRWYECDRHTFAGAFLGAEEPRLCYGGPQFRLPSAGGRFCDKDGVSKKICFQSSPWLGSGRALSCCQTRWDRIPNQHQSSQRQWCLVAAIERKSSASRRSQPGWGQSIAP